MLEISPQAFEEKTELLFQQGNLFFASQNYSSAIKSYDELLKIQPNDYQNLGCYESTFYKAWYNRGIALSKTQRYEEEVVSYNKALEIKSDFYEAWYNQGVVLEELGRL